MPAPTSVLAAFRSDPPHRPAEQAASASGGAGGAKAKRRAEEVKAQRRARSRRHYQRNKQRINAQTVERRRARREAATLEASGFNADALKWLATLEPQFQELRDTRREIERFESLLKTCTRDDGEPQAP